uniref:Uncharacterized protein n=1 Tax=Castor canadensis TaxID=51338 RepID=A0A8C0WL02_CASCN|nr:putative methyl-CpG-binding domain protein 3-like 3 [Castor canadensis]
MVEPATNAFPSQPVLGRLKRNMIPEALERKKRVPVAKGRHRAGGGAALPVRMTSCIFKRPVTRITAHPGNEVRHRHGEENLEKPQQLCALRRLQGLQVHSSEGQLLTALDFESASKIISLGIQGKSPGQAGAEDLRTCPEPSPGQVPYQRETIPGGLPPSFYHQEVTSADIRRQMRKVKQARKRLAEAVKADSLAREAERRNSQDEWS